MVNINSASINLLVICEIHTSCHIFYSYFFVEHCTMCFFNTPYCVLWFVGSEAETCNEGSKTYTGFVCLDDPCVEACDKEGFTDGRCFPISLRPIVLQCMCKKECWIKTCCNYRMMRDAKSNILFSKNKERWAMDKKLALSDIPYFFWN